MADWHKMRLLPQFVAGIYVAVTHNRFCKRKMNLRRQNRRV